MPKTIQDLVIGIGYKADLKALDDARKSAKKHAEETKTAYEKAAKEVRNAQRAAAEATEKAAKKAAQEAVKAARKTADAAKDAAQEASKAAKSAEKAFAQMSATAAKRVDQVKSLATSFTIAGAAAAAAGGATFKFVDSVTQGLDETAKAARAAGLGAEEYQRLAFAAERSGVQMEGVAKGARRLEKSLDDARKNSTSPAAAAFKELGISMVDLGGKSFEQRLGIVADALNKVGHEQRRTLLSAQLLGEEAGPRMASLLADGSEGIRGYGDEAERLGVVLGEDALAEAEKFQDQLTNVKNEAKGVARGLATELIPKVREALPVFSSAAKGVAEFARQAIGLTESLGGEGTGLVAVLGGMAVVLGGLPGLFAAAGAAGVVMGNQLGEALAPLLGLERIRDMLEESRALRKGTATGRAGTDALSKLAESSRSGTLGSLSQDQYEKLAEEVLRGASANQKAGSAGALAEAQGILADLDQIRDIQQRTTARDTLLDRQGADLKQLADDQIKARSERDRMQRLLDGDKAKKEKKDLMSVDELTRSDVGRTGLLTELQRIGSLVGATDLAVQRAANDAAKKLKEGASAKVARDAGIGTLSSLTGKKIDSMLGAFTGARGKEMGVELPALNAAPTVQVVINNYSFQNDFEIHGVSDPQRVGEIVVAKMRAEFSRASANLLEPVVR